MTEFAILDKRWLRPSLMIFCAQEPTQGSGSNAGKWDLGTDYLYLTDDGRDPVSIDPQRIEYKQRMLNGRMRSYYVTDKISISTSWKDLPSRSQDSKDKYISEYQRRTGVTTKYAAGQEMKNWYENHTGDFWLLLVYDGGENTQIDLTKQVEKYHVFFENFNFTVVKRGQLHDLWDVNISLVEA